VADKTIFVLNGPNLEHLGTREPALYGRETLADVETMCRAEAGEAGLALRFHQSNAEHELIGWVHEARAGAVGLVINPAALSYAGYGLYDALRMCACPVVEVHISNIHRRDEAWRARSLMTKAATGIISGLGVHGYALAVRHVARLASA
jgi:3-dehydroquinate dehydratase II